MTDGDIGQEGHIRKVNLDVRPALSRRVEVGGLSTWSEVQYSTEVSNAIHHCMVSPVHFRRRLLKAA
jgi:hypothetical protein